MICNVVRFRDIALSRRDRLGHGVCGERCNKMRIWSVGGTELDSTVDGWMDERQLLNRALHISFV